MYHCTMPADKEDVTRSNHEDRLSKQRKKTHHCQNQLIQMENKDDNFGIILAWIEDKIEFMSRSREKL